MTEKIKNAMQKLSDLWFLGVFVIFLYYTENKYFNMLEAKSTVVCFGALWFCGLSAVCGLGLLYALPVVETVKKGIRSMTAIDLAVCLLAFAAVFSNLVTPYKEAAFFGSFGWRVGTLWALCLFCVYVFLQGFLRGSRSLWYAAALSVGLQFVWVLLNGFYVDIFGYHALLAAKDYPRYVGSIGNTNWYVGFLALVLPFFYVGSVTAEKKRERAALLFLLFLGTMSAVSVSCDGVYLFLTVLLGMGLWYGLEKEEWLCRVLRNHLVMALSLIALFLLRRLIPATPVDGITAELLEVRVLLIIPAACLIFLLAGKKWSAWLIAHKKMMRGQLAFLGAAQSFFLIYTQWLRFNDAWGTNRGKIWRIAVEAFSKLPLTEKIFGGGISCFGYYYEALTGSDWVRNAHNEFLEALVTMGIAGLLAYLFLIVVITRQKTKQDPVLIAGKISLLAYFGQALVNNPQGLNGAVFITILALYRRRSKDVLQ